MPFPHRIEKPSTSKRGLGKGRGRPVQWSEPWRKRLVMLRLCGLQLGEILQVLKILSGGTLPAKTRRAEQILRDLLSKGYQRYCAMDNAKSRHRIAFLKGLHPSKSKSKFFRGNDYRTSARFSCNKRPLPSSTSSDIRNLAFMTCDRDDVPSSLDTKFDAGKQKRSNGSAKVEYTNLPSYSGQELPSDSDKARSPIKEGSSSMETTSTLQTSRSFVASLSRTKPSFRSDRSLQIRQILRTASRSSSFISDVVSLLRRFSGRSISTASTSDSEHLPFALEKPPRVEKQQEIDNLVDFRAISSSRLHEENAAIIKNCCFANPNCFHQTIKMLALVEDEAEALRRTKDLVIRDINWQGFQSFNNPGAYRNTGVFFAARSGMHASSFISLLELVIDLNTVNSDGQNFLFVLDPTKFRNNNCCCTADALTPDTYHGHELQCLMSALEKRGFKFDHIDHSGHSFVTYLTLNYPSSFEWMNGLSIGSTLNNNTIRQLSEKRDYRGMSLSDYIKLERRHMEYLIGASHHIRLKPEQVSKSLSEMRAANQLWIRIFQYWPSDNKVDDILASNFSGHGPSLLNCYGMDGQTLYTRFIRFSAENFKFDPKLITLKWLEILKTWGANTHMRYGDGSTALHKVTKSTHIELLDWVIKTGVDINHRDHAGYTALDYAVEAFNWTRRSRSLASDMAIALKCVLLLVDNGATLSFAPSSRGLKILRAHGQEYFIPGPGIDEAPLVDRSTSTVDLNDFVMGFEDNDLVFSTSM